MRYVLLLTLVAGPAGADGLSGRVVDEAGKPAAGVTICVRDGMWPRWGTITAVDGCFRLLDLPRDRELLVEAERGDQGLVRPVTVRAPFPQSLALTIGLVPRVFYTGRVVDLRGRPMPGVSVILTRLRFEPGRVGVVERQEEELKGETDARGGYRFAVRDLTASYEVGLGYDEARPCRGGRLFGEQGVERRFTDLVLLAGDSVVTGRVVDARGRPAARAVVHWALGRSALADEQGRFRLEGLPAEPVLLVAAGRAGGAAFARVRPGAEALLVLKE